MGSKTTKVSVPSLLFTKYGEQSLNNILQNQSKYYLELIYSKTIQQCQKIIQQTLQKGNIMINSYKMLTIGDYQNLINSRNLKTSTKILKRQELEEILGLNIQLSRYEDIRKIMKLYFQYQQEKLAKEVWRELTNKNKKSNHYPEYHQLRDIEQQKVLEQIEDLFAESLVAKNIGGNVEWNIFYGFNFTDYHQEKFNELIPESRCEQLRDNIRRKFDQRIDKNFKQSSVMC